MRKFSTTIALYVLKAVLPYFFISWLILSVIFFVQQAGEFADLFFSATLPGALIWQLSFALVPNVIAFTCPIAALVGVVIGLSRMQGDREFVALRAAGVGNLQISICIIILGIILSAFSYYINLKGVPLAAQIVRRVAISAALFKLESPVEPGVFNADIERFTVYVREGDIEKGNWEKIFIFQEDSKNLQTRLITAETGRIDYGGQVSDGDRSEIVLSDAEVVTFNDKEEGNVSVEQLGSLRFAVATQRGELAERLAKTKETPEEMGLAELYAYAEAQTGRDRTEAFLLWQRRLILSITPLIFTLLGTALVTRFDRGGRGFGALLAVGTLVLYYLAMLAGEQLVRVGIVRVEGAAILPIGLSLLAIVFLFLRRGPAGKSGEIPERILNLFRAREARMTRSVKSSLLDLTTGILDYDLITTLLRNYLLVFVFFALTFLIFTAFELWKFAGTIDNGILLLSGYLLFLIPFIYLQLAPTALMVSALITYVIKSRQNEIVTWTASGRSVYRLLFPCFVLMLAVGALNFGLQQTIVPYTNRVQDSLRAQIRSRNEILKENGRYWVAGLDTITSFEKKGASDNVEGSVTDVLLVEFDTERWAIRSVSRGATADWSGGEIRLAQGVESIEILDGSGVQRTVSGERYRNLTVNPLRGTTAKPGHLTIGELLARYEITAADSEKRIYMVAIQKRFAALIIPFVIVLFSAPFALTLGRTGNVVTIGAAVGLWLLFVGTTSIFEQLGIAGVLSPGIAVWSPLVVFTMIGLFLVSRVKT